MKTPVILLLLSAVLAGCATNDINNSIRPSKTVKIDIINDQFFSYRVYHCDSFGRTCQLLGRVNNMGKTSFKFRPNPIGNKIVLRFGNGETWVFPGQYESQRFSGGETWSLVVAARESLSRLVPFRYTN